MSEPRLALVASHEDAEIAGVSGRFGWGECVHVEPGGPPNAVSTIALGSAQAAESAEPLARLLGDSPDTEPPGPTGTRLIATAGEGLWAVAPWPAADALFGLPPAEGGCALVLGPVAARRTALAEKLLDRDVPVDEAEGLTRAGLEKAAVVVFAGRERREPRVPFEPEPFPAAAIAVLAARRVLVLPRTSATFGLFSHVDHFAYLSDDEAASWAHLALRYPDAFESVRAMGALAAERHRASVAYGRLLVDLGLEAARRA